LGRQTRFKKYLFNKKSSLFKKFQKNTSDEAASARLLRQKISSGKISSFCVLFYIFSRKISQKISTGKREKHSEFEKFIKEIAHRKRYKVRTENLSHFRRRK
jgi:hypothetical protein